MTSELRMILERVRTDPDFYGRYEGKTFGVPSKFCEHGRYCGYNIVKKKDHRSNKTKTKKKGGNGNKSKADKVCTDCRN
jgi:hypothetical protein